MRLEYRAAMEIAVVGAAALIALDEGAHPDGVALTAVAPTCIRATAVEEALHGATPNDCRRGRVRGRADGADLRRSRKRALPTGRYRSWSGRAGARIQASTPMSYPLELTVNGVAHSLAVNGGARC